MKNVVKISLLLILAGLTIWLINSGFLHLLTFENLKARQNDLRAWTIAHYVEAVLAYFGIYVATTAASLPGATVLTLAGGAFFGLIDGTIIVSFASTIGATLCMLGSRLLFRDLVAQNFKSAYDRVEQGLAKEGVFYLFALRLIPAVPFFIVNLVFGLTKMPAVTFLTVSQLGMLPATLVYVNAGTQLSQIDSIRGILSFPVILSFALLGIVPGLAKLIISLSERRRVYSRFLRPSRFDYDVIVIGAGAGGMESAYIAAELKSKVLLIEKEKIGGSRVYTGCVPSKSLIRSAQVAQMFRRGNEFGMQSVAPQVDFSRVFTRVRNIIKKIEANHSVDRFANFGVDCLQGEAKIADPFRVHVGEKILTTRNIIVATGAAPVMPQIPGLKDVPHYTAASLWQMSWVPKKLLVMGGGPIGCELAQAFARLGCETTLVEQRKRLLRKEDEDVAALISQRFKSEGIQVKLNTEITQFEPRPNGGRATTRDGQSFEFDAVMVALGRRAQSGGFGLEELGISIRRDGTIETDEYLRTKFPNILAVGDVAGPFQFTHAATYLAGYAVLNALCSPFKAFKVDYSTIPWCTFVDPEVARVGINEILAQEHGIAVEMHMFPFDQLDRSICDSEDAGLIKVFTEKESARILGVTIVGARAGDLIPEFVLAMRKNLTLADILNSVHAYPTFAEANRLVADIWKKKNVPYTALRLFQSYHAWRRGDSSKAAPSMR